MNITNINDRIKMKAVTSFFIAIAILFVANSTVFGENLGLTVVGAVWTNRIDSNKNPVVKYENSAKNIKQLYLWTRVQAGTDALEYLKSKGKLPILHQWFTYLGSLSQFDESIDTIQLNIGNTDDVNKLSWQIQQNDHFVWRTWSMKRNLRPGWWKVKVVYSDGDAVLCSDVPCEYEIMVE